MKRNFSRSFPILCSLLMLGILIAVAGCNTLNQDNLNGSVVIDNSNQSFESEGGKVTLEIAQTEISVQNETAVQEPTTAEDAQKEEEYPVILINETQKVSLKPKAVDPDNDDVSYYFSAPLNASGEWQTKAGDAGEYLLEVNATDGVSVVSKKFKLVVRNLNRAPVLGKLQDVAVNEGDKITLNPIALDPDGDDVSVKISGWMNTTTKETGYDDAGTYYVTVTASDPKGLSESQKIKIVVNNVDRAPQLMPFSAIMVTEGEKVLVKPVASDPDKDSLTYLFAKPLDENGEWQTKEGDAGKYEINVTASDGELSDSKIVDVIVQALNKPPVFEAIGNRTVSENETVTFTVKANDPDNTELKYDVRELPLGARFNSITQVFTWTPDFDTVTTSEGSKDFLVVFTVKDGQLSDEKTVAIKVNNVNRPPEFVATS